MTDIPNLPAPVMECEVSRPSMCFCLCLPVYSLVLLAACASCIYAKAPSPAHRPLYVDRWHGWACFCCSVVMIGLLTAFIGDVSSHFGCTIGLLDSVTAISIVAFGTSVPGTRQGGHSSADRRRRQGHGGDLPVKQPGWDKTM